MEIIKYGKDVYITADGKNVSQAVKEIIEKERAKEAEDNG